MNFPVAIDVAPSRRLRAALFFAHVVAIAVLLALMLALPATALAIPLLLVSLWRARRLPPMCCFVLQPDGRLDCGEAGGAERPARVLPGSTVFVWLVVLRYRVEGEARNRVRVVLSDSLPAADFRRLRVWLRWRAVA